MPTAKQRSLHEKLAAMFGRTPDWRESHRGMDFSRLRPEDAYMFLGALFDRLDRWRYRRLPRYAGLPRTEEEKTILRFRARREEHHARLVVPDENDRPIDERPSAMASAIPYGERNPDLKEDLRIDYPGLFRDAPKV